MLAATCMAVGNEILGLRIVTASASCCRSVRLQCGSAQAVCKLYNSRLETVLSCNLDDVESRNDQVIPERAVCSLVVEMDCRLR